MHETENCQAFLWADGMHLVQGLGDGLRGPAPAEDAAGAETTGTCSTQSGTGDNPGPAESDDRHPLHRARAILDAARDGAPVDRRRIVWALRVTGDM